MATAPSSMDAAMAYCNFLLPRTACSQKETKSHRERREGMQKAETSERERDDAGERKQAREAAGGGGKRRNVTAPLKHTLQAYTNAGCDTHQNTNRVFDIAGKKSVDG